MALEDEVKARVSAQRLVHLTNPGDATATTISDPRLSLAAADTRAEFEARVEIPFDDANPIHVDAGIDGVLCKLFRRSGADSENDGRSYCKRWEERLEQLRASIGAGARAVPATNANQVPTGDNENQRPKFDRSRFQDYIPLSRSGFSDDEADSTP